MQFITFPPRKIGTKIEVQNGLPDGQIAVYCDSDACECGGTVAPCFCKCHHKSDLIVPGAQPKLAGRSWPALKESKSFDSERLAASPLFERKLFT